MLIKLDKTVKFGKQHGGFGMEILYPGTILPQSKDTGIATIGRIDQARVTPGTLIPMHPHSDDEILTYLRSGSVKHLDSEGLTEIISSKKLMMMNAGARFYHEELVLNEVGVLEGLQIFIRPETGGLNPKVQFHNLHETYSLNAWRKLAGKDNNYPLEIRSSTWIQDMRQEMDKSSILPSMPAENTACLYYVFKGKVKVNEDVILHSGESIFLEKENPTFTSLETSDVILFITDKTAPYFEGGMYSGNQKNDILTPAFAKVNKQE